MLKYLVIWLCLSSSALSIERPTTRGRIRRSPWPFSSPNSISQVGSKSKTGTVNLVPNKEELETLEKAGFPREKLDLSKRPLEQVRRYRSIDQATHDSELPQEPPEPVQLSPRPLLKAPSLTPPEATTLAPRKTPIPLGSEHRSLGLSFLEDFGDLMPEGGRLVEPQPSVPMVEEGGFEVGGQQQSAGPDAVRRSIAGRPDEHTRPESWSRSWNPDAAYSTHSQHPSPAAIPPASPILQRRSDQELQETYSTPSSTTTPIITAPHGLPREFVLSTKASRDRLKEVVSKIKLPENLMPRLKMTRQDFENIINSDGKPSTRTAERLRFLQHEFHVRKAQMGPALYAHMKRHLEKQLPPELTAALKI